MSEIRIFLLVAFVLVSCHRNDRLYVGSKPMCVDRVLAIDDSLGKIRNRECETIPVSQTIANYTSRMKTIDMKSCPEAFATAYTSHRKAWEDLATVTQNYPELRGEMHVLFKQLETSKDSVLFKKRVATVWETWAEVENTAGKK